MKKILNISLVLLLSLCLMTGCGKSKKTDNDDKPASEDNVKVNTNEGVIQNQEVEIFKFENTSLIYKDGGSTLLTTVTNTSDSESEAVEFKIHVMDGEREIVTLSGFVGPSLKPGESKILKSTYGSDLSNATSINYEIVK